MRGLISSLMSLSAGPSAGPANSGLHRPKSASRQAAERPTRAILAKTTTCIALHGRHALLMKRVCGTDEGRRHIAPRDNRAIGNGISQPLTMHEGIECPFFAQGPGISYFDEWVQCRTGVIHSGTAVIVIDYGSALPGKSKSDTPGASQLP